LFKAGGACGVSQILVETRSGARGAPFDDIRTDMDAQAEGQSLLNIVVGKGKTALDMLSSEDEALLVGEINSSLAL
jgi:hypothetical protein